MRKSVNMVGVGSSSESNTLIRPLFSLTNTRPSGENTTFVGLDKPLKTTCSLKPVGTTAACAGASGTAISAAGTNSNPMIAVSNRRNGMAQRTHILAPPGKYLDAQPSPPPGEHIEVLVRMTSDPGQRKRRNQAFALSGS